jgi:hypothetical protein
VAVADRVAVAGWQWDGGIGNDLGSILSGDNVENGWKLTEIRCFWDFFFLDFFLFLSAAEFRMRTNLFGLRFVWQWLIEWQWLGGSGGIVRDLSWGAF